MGSEKLHDPKGPPQISETTIRIRRILTALERALQDAPDTVPMNLFSLPVTSQQGQTRSRTFSEDAFFAKISRT